MQMLLLSLFILLLAKGTLSLDITVSNNGSDSPSCLQGDIDCKTLDHSLTVFDSVTNDVIITITNDVTLTSPHHLQFLSDIVITAATVATVTCNEIGTGLSISYSTNVTISNISWLNCSIKHETSSLGNWSCNVTDCEPFITPFAYSAIFLFNCTDFTLSHASFSSSRGSGLSMYNVMGDVTIEDSQFLNHTLLPPVQPCIIPEDYTRNCSPQSTGLYIEFSYCQNMTSYCPPDKYKVHNVNYYIGDCLFEGNSNMGAYRSYTDLKPIAGLNRENHWPFGRGGGMGVVLRAYEFKHLNVTVNRTHFHDNRAVYGGGMFLHLEPSYSDHGQFDIIYCVFSQNKAILNGGGVDLDMNVLFNTNNSKIILDKKLRNRLLIRETMFYSNEAYWGGGVSMVTYPSNISYLIIEFISSGWHENKYTSGAGAFGILRKEKPEQLYFFVTDVSITDCVFGHTRAVLSNESVSLLSCSVYSEGIPLWFYGNTLFESNCASALCLSDTGTIFFDTVKFINNTGFNGGALFLTGKSYMTVSKNVKVEFINNSAYQFGGAIYYLAPPPLEMNTSGSCFVWYHDEDNTNIALQYWCVNVLFIGNRAVQGGDAAYISDPEKCIWPHDKSLFDPDRLEKFDYSSQDNSRTVISTPIKSIRFSFKYEHAPSMNGLLTHTLMPGEKLQVKVETIDDFNQTIPAILSIECHRYSNYINSTFSHDLCMSNSLYGVGSRLVQSNALLENVISGPRSSQELILVFRVCQPISVLIPLRISLTDCHRGYFYNDIKQQCTCADDLGTTGPVLCITDGNSSTDNKTVGTNSIPIPCVRRHYWAGNLPGDDRSGLVYQFCHSGKCSYGRRCSHYADYFQLPDPPCHNNLSGQLCSSCEDGLSLTYNSYSCSKCNTASKIGLVLLIFLECIIIVIVILAFLKFNVRVNTAMFYGFLYFYSVLPMFLWVDLPIGLQVTIALISSITSLDFTILQYLNFCLFDSVRAIHYEFIHYVYPVTIILIIAIVIKIDRYCLRKFQFFTGNAAIQALCIILLIAYTSVSETSLKILLPLSYHSTDSVTAVKQQYVYVDPGLEYMDTKNHLPYWLVALIVEFGFVLPFAVLMLVAPWLMRFVNLSRIKPVLDEYQNCFHDDRRWCAGVYLLARQILFLISMVSTDPEQMSYIQQIFCLLLLILIATIQPYRSKLINRMDIFFLLLLTIISFSGYNATSSSTFHSETLHTTVLAILSLLPFIILSCGFCIVTVYKCVYRLRMSTTHLQYVLANQSDSLSVNSLPNTDESRSTDVSNGDLPPRFYDEEEDYRQEKTRLLQSAPRRMGTIGAVYYPPVKNAHTN